MLNHCDPAFVGLCRRWLFAFVDIFEGDFAKLLCIGIDCWPGERAVKAGVTVELASVSY